MNYKEKMNNYLDKGKIELSDLGNDNFSLKGINFTIKFSDLDYINEKYLIVSKSDVIDYITEKYNLKYSDIKKTLFNFCSNYISFFFKIEENKYIELKEGDYGF